MDDPCRSNLLALRLAVMAVCAGLGVQADAKELHAAISDRDGQPVEEVVVYAVALDAARPGPEPPTREPAVMDQRNEQFEPHILVTQAGSTVSFPNSDTVSHHVYSFSEPKRFELPLYQGTAHPPVTFDRAGIVDVGCNIHDHMEAHIVVVDTPYFGISGADGRAELVGLPEGDYAVHVFTPRLRAEHHPAPQRVSIGNAGLAQVQIRFRGRLRPPHHAQSESLSWSHY